jgi:hypothetical protein
VAACRGTRPRWHQPWLVSETHCNLDIQLIYIFYLNPSSPLSLVIVLLPILCLLLPLLFSWRHRQLMGIAFALMIGKRPFLQPDPLSNKKKQDLVSKRTEIFHSDVIKKDWLCKLPPASNSVQAWRRRYFQLTIMLTKNVVTTGPVILYYYDNPLALKPKV